MFEANILRDHLAETGDGLALRELRWGDLVERLEAASDCRSALHRVFGGAGGGFDQFPKLNAEALHDGKHSVNHNALEHRKIVEAHQSRPAIHAALGDREN